MQRNGGILSGTTRQQDDLFQVKVAITREDEKVISRKSQNSSAAESEAEKADGEDLDGFTHG